MNKVTAKIPCFEFYKDLKSELQPLHSKTRLSMLFENSLVFAVIIPLPVFRKSQESAH